MYDEGVPRGVGPLRVRLIVALKVQGFANRNRFQVESAALMGHIATNQRPVAQIRDHGIQNRDFDPGGRR